MIRGRCHSHACFPKDRFSGYGLAVKPWADLHSELVICQIFVKHLSNESNNNESGNLALI